METSWRDRERDRERRTAAAVEQRVPRSTVTVHAASRRLGCTTREIYLLLDDEELEMGRNSLGHFEVTLESIELLERRRRGEQG